MDPFAALMRTYCIDYTNSHDLSVCDSIMEPDYVVRICGLALERDTAYKPSVEDVFRRFPALGLVVHELVTNGDRLAMRFSEHGATASGVQACWAGIGLYDWNGSKLVSCRVEQDFWSQRRQLDDGHPRCARAPTSRPVARHDGATERPGCGGDRAVLARHRRSGGGRERADR